MLSVFASPSGINSCLNPQDSIFSFPGTSLLAATSTFGEVDVSETKRTYFSKTRLIIFLGDFGSDVCCQFALFGPAMKKKPGSNFPWLNTTIKIYHCWCGLIIVSRTRKFYQVTKVTKSSYDTSGNIFIVKYLKMLSFLW